MENTTQKIKINELAELCGLSPRRLYQLAAEKKIPTATKGEFPKVESIKALFVWFARDSENLKREKLLLVTATRELKETELSTAKGQTMLRSIATATSRHTILTYHSFVRAEIETHSPANRKEKLIALGVSPEIAAQFLEFDLKASQNTIDRVESKCAKAAEVNP